ncbi:response regulator transcription factor (plasmid) [Streptomyces sp. R39]|uniref:Response regulator transcription factor n=1 Tax=Streptomyces sp. R39 TaxID=3238631 RepID=A0AB39R905_9ACTN
MTISDPESIVRTVPGQAYKPTGRQVQVLSGIARGHTNAEIADHLDIAWPTVQRQVSLLGRGLGTNARAEMVAVGYEQGWLTNLSPEPRERIVLSDRCQKVLQCIAAGKSNEEIAADLYLSVNTVKTHVRRILGVFRARRRAHAVALAYQHGHLCIHGGEVLRFVNWPGGLPRHRGPEEGWLPDPARTWRGAASHGRESGAAYASANVLGGRTSRQEKRTRLAKSSDGGTS